MARISLAHYESLKTRLNESFEEVIDLISPAGMNQQIREFIDVGEYGLALETLCDAIADSNIIIAKKRHAHLLSLAQSMGIDEQLVAKIKQRSD